MRYFSLLVVLSVSVVYGQHCPERAALGGCREAMEKNLEENERVLMDTWSVPNLEWQSDAGTVQFVGKNCQNAIILCPNPHTPAQILYPPAFNMSGSRIISINATLEAFGGVGSIGICINFNSELESFQAEYKCYTLSHATPMNVSVPRDANLCSMEIKAPDNQQGDFCLSIQRLTVKYDACPCEVKDLVLYPEVPIGKEGRFQGSCLLNSLPLTSLEYSSNTCSPLHSGARCACRPGYQEKNSTCEKCRTGTYSRSHGTPCRPCPANSKTSKAGASNCTCKAGFFRTADQSHEDACTKPPSAVRHSALKFAASTSLSLQWLCPAQSDLSDVFYNVCHSPMNSQTATTCTTFRPSPGAACLTVYNITGLKPHTRYSVCITSQNSVSHLQPESEEDRTVCHAGFATLEDVPSLPILKRLCTVVIWKPPAEPNGYITKYELKFVDASGQVESFVYNKTENFHLTTTIQREQNVGVQIRVKNGRYYSEWVPSSPQPIDCSALPTCPPVRKCDCASAAPITTTEEPTTMAPTTTEEATTMAPTTTEEATTIAPTTTEEPTTMAPTTTEEVTTMEPMTTTETTTEQPTAAASSDPCAGYPSCGSNVHFEHRGNSVTSVGMSDIGTGNSALYCRTDFPFCCRNQGKGEFRYPNGTEVGIKKADQAFYRNRGAFFIRLNARPSRQAPTGSYGCILPDVGGDCCTTIDIS